MVAAGVQTMTDLGSTASVRRTGGQGGPVRGRKTTLVVAIFVGLLAGSTVGVAAQDEAADPVENPNTGEVSDTLIPQDGALAVYEEHLRVVNDCDWLGLMAQYPNDAEIHLPGATVIKGRQAIGDFFAGFVLDPADGGLCGITFTEETRFEVGDTEIVQWVVDADFLAEPYRGSDAYVSDGQYMAAQVATFDGADLMMAEAAAE
jgi:hypothetical protein